MPIVSQTPSTTSPGRAETEARRRHEELLLRADVRRLAIALAPYGILHRDTLAKVAGAHEWRPGAFERALDEAFRRGVIVRLPENFCADPARVHHHPGRTDAAANADQPAAARPSRPPDAPRPSAG
jgi:hypothetical protein